MANNNDKFISRENAKTLWGYMIDLLTGKQNKLTFDDTPTQGSDNPVKSGGIFTALAGKGTYSKPQNGIPKTDLENAVQTSLGLADSALQSETDPTVPSWAKQTNKPSYTQDEVPDGTTYKRVTQTEKDAWSGKQNALTTTQMQAVNSGITSAGVAQISTNQSNILYGLNTGVKNKLPCQISEIYQPSDTGLKCIYNKDGTYTVTGTKSTSDAYLDITNIFADNLNGDHVAYISVTGTGTCNIAVYGWNGTRYTMMLSTASSQDFNIGNYAYALFRIRFMSSVGASFNATIKIMVCTLDAWNQSHDWQPPALPNYDLTRLEAEDRAALAEEIDAGAKNIIPVTRDEIKSYNAWSWNGYTATNGGITYTLNADGSITMNGTSTATGEFSILPRTAGRSIFPKAGTYVLYAQVPKSLNPSGVENVFIGVNRTVSGSGVRYGIDKGDGATFTVQSSEVNNANGIWIGFSSAGLTVNNVTIYPMICTKAAFGVSSKFVPYRPNWDLVCQRSGAITKRNVTGTDWTLTDVSLTGSSGFVYFLSAGVDASGNYPTGILISTSNNSSDFMDASKLVCKNDDTRTTRMFSCAAIDMPYQSTTYYVWSKSTVSATNAVTLMWHKEPR